MKNKPTTFFLVIFLTAVAFLLRFYNITTNPPSLNIDEVSYGYSAYSILKTGRDENGVFMPLTFQSTGDYKNPVLIYSLVSAIAFFGLNEFGVRFTTAFLGILSVPVFFFLILSLIKDRRIALTGAALLTISPWHIYYSRFASDSLIGLFLLILGVWFFQKIKGVWVWTFLSSLALILSMYSYHSLRFFIPIFISILVFIEIRKKEIDRRKLFVFVILNVILAIPLMYLTLFGPANTRASMVFLSQDIDYTRYVVLDHIQRFGEQFLLFFFWIKRYLNYFQPDFLFFTGLNMTLSGTLGLGVLYLFELPWLVLGVGSLFKEKIPNRIIVILWVLLGLLPASLANNEQSSSRSLIILPMLILIVSIGAVKFFTLLWQIKNRYIKSLIYLLYSFFIFIYLVQAVLVFAVHFPKQRGEAFMEGTKETVLYAISNKDKYQEIVYDPYRGIEAPYIVSIPYMYILFYSQYDPRTYQLEKKIRPGGSFGFNKFTIRRVDWREDRHKKDTLFIASPWSLPEKDLRQEEILKKVYLSNGDLAFLIVSPKP